MTDVKTTGTPAGEVVESGVDVVGGGELEVGVSGVDVVDGSIVVGGIDVVWMTVVGALGAKLDVEETRVEGAGVLEKVTTKSSQCLRWMKLFDGRCAHQYYSWCQLSLKLNEMSIQMRDSDDVVIERSNWNFRGCYEREEDSKSMRLGGFDGLLCCCW